jgi:hypothetical protein
METLKLIGSILAIVIVAPILWFSWGMDNPKTAEPEPTQFEVNQTSARYRCRDVVKAMLHDPESADLGWIGDWKTGLLNDDEKTMAVQAQIRARNGFGAMRLTNFQCLFDVLPEDQGVRLRDVAEY